MDVILICLATFGGCLLGSLVPLVNTEILVLSMAGIGPAGLLVPIVLLAATGQLVGQIVLYMGGKGTLRLSQPRPGGVVAATLARLERHRSRSGLVLLASATAGLPPLFAMSVACGMIGFGLQRFMVLALAGRIVRFGLLVQVPHIIGKVI